MAAHLSTPAAASDVIQSRKLEAESSMPACVARMVAAKDTLSCSSGEQSFSITSVADGGGFATLLKGQVHLAAHKHTSVVAAAKIALDLESAADGTLTEQQKRSYQASMRHEHHIYEQLQGTSGSGSGSGIPKVFFAGAIKKADDPEHPAKLHLLSFLVMEMLGTSVGHLSLELQSYTKDTRLLVNHGIGMLKVLKFMHARGLVHRDVKPDNYCLPLGFDPQHPTAVDTVYVVDMGMAQRYRQQGFDWDSRDCLYMGTVDYSSVRALRGHHASPWDDLEGLGIALLEMATGGVPFDLVQGDDPLTAERLVAMAAQKEKQWQKLLSDPQTPAFIKQWMRHLRSAPAKQHPTDRDYAALQSILQSMLAPPVTAASTAWSCDMSVLQLQPAGQQPDLAVSSRKRAAPAVSAASNLVSTMSEAATVMQPKRAKRMQPDDDDTMSMATGLLGFSQGVFESQPEE